MQKVAVSDHHRRTQLRIKGMEIETVRCVAGAASNSRANLRGCCYPRREKKILKVTRLAEAMTVRISIFGTVRTISFRTGRLQLPRPLTLARRDKQQAETRSWRATLLARKERHSPASQSLARACDKSTVEPPKGSSMRIQCKAGPQPHTSKSAAPHHFLDLYLWHLLHLSTPEE